MQIGFFLQITVFLRAKEDSNDPPPVNNGLKWHKMVQLWDQLIVKDGT